MNINGFYKDKKVLITGHTGFKGSWLTEWLLMMGAKVTGLALPPPTDPALFDQLELAGRCDHRIGDIRDRVLVHRVIHEVRPDVILHLAAQPLVRLSYSQPVETYETNVMGTAHVLDALRDADWPCAAVMITTDKVYENKEWLHAYRESDPLGGYDPYSSSKACAELVIQSYRQSFFTPGKGRMVAVASARAGNVIGGGDWAQDRIVPDCIRALAKGEVIRVRNPDATRPWQHVLEPLSGYLLLGMRLLESLDVRREASDVRRETLGAGSKTENRLTGMSGPPVPPLTSHISRLTSYASSFNFGPDLSSNRTVRALVEELLKHWPGRWEDLSNPDAPHEASMLNLETSKAFHILGWAPRWSFEKTVAHAVKWYQACERAPENCRQVMHEQMAAYVGGQT